ncbi:conserved hypothetical protein [Klebsiella quasipneumoniae subsp. similipneumoniae]|nr:conserved hypothetical protein [Klebsiella quasipneumoniae subsp. similipneumoniae]SBN12877.1 conserved hypothetical protein [Klebsiella variicola]
MFLVSFGIGAYIAIIAFSLVFYFIMKKILYLKEEKKGKMVWKRAIITW